ncbi:hypothetical protein GCM10025864_42640 [Luteimicrobium album]|uniref:Signal recognition particle SRP54 helical bundle domain-containing protein n=1 Tax=Luteimicrobium album TaxID=1054550 RepID=A0ABQ6I9X3_9MICO|nr:hypothetical protein GCM10025864_42640 [Luteimicrobium album]
MFNTLSDRLAQTFKNLRTKGRLSEADIDATIREIRRALLDADVAVPVVREFTGQVRERALSAEVSGALNPAQQVVKIVNEELVGVLGGETRTLRFAKTPPTVIMLAGLQGAGKTTFAGKLGRWLKDQGHTPSSWRPTCSAPTRSPSSRSSPSARASRCSRRTRATRAAPTRRTDPSSATRSPSRATASRPRASVSTTS